jgi:hypothetical protein
VVDTSESTKSERTGSFKTQAQAQPSSTLKKIGEAVVSNIPGARSDLFTSKSTLLARQQSRRASAIAMHLSEVRGVLPGVRGALPGMDADALEKLQQMHEKRSKS